MKLFKFRFRRKKVQTPEYRNHRSPDTRAPFALVRSKDGVHTEAVRGYGFTAETWPQTDPDATLEQALVWGLIHCTGKDAFGEYRYAYTFLGLLLSRPRLLAAFDNPN